MARDKTDKSPVANEWGIPDWRDEAAYGDVKVWTFERWRWEFLRRRHDVRVYFDAHAEESYRYWQNFFAVKRAFTSTTLRLRPDEPGFGAVVEVQDRKRIGYAMLPNPRISEQPEKVIWPYRYDDTLDFIRGNQIGAYGYRGTVGESLDMDGVMLSGKQKARIQSTLDSFPCTLELHEMAVIFDLNKPMEPQLKQARKELRWRQYDLLGKIIQERRRPTLWFGYLRALDGREAGATWAQMAKTFFEQGLLDRHRNPSGGYCPPPPQAARDKWDAANNLRSKF